MDSARQYAGARRARTAVLRKLGYESYNDYLRSPHWRDLRRLAAAELPNVCLCGATEQLQLHHMTYERLGHEQLVDLIWLCATCHNLTHVLERRGDTDLALAGLGDPERAAITAPARLAVSARQQQEYDDAHSKKLARRQVRSVAQRVRLAVTNAIRDGIDPTETLDAIERIVDDIAARQRST